jgi:hypothetical protein
VKWAAAIKRSRISVQVAALVTGIYIMALPQHRKYLTHPSYLLYVFVLRPDFLQAFAFNINTFYGFL